MIVVVLLAVLGVLLATTPWNRLTTTGRLWALAAGLNTLIFFSMPITAATSPWRPVIGRVLAVSAGVSLLLLLLGLGLRHRHVAHAGLAAWLGPLIVGALPGVFYVFFWIIGPLY